MTVNSTFILKLNYDYTQDMAFPAGNKPDDPPVDIPPPAVSDLSASADGPYNIDLSWSAVARANSYRIYRRISDSTAWQDSGTTQTPGYTAVNLTSGTQYQFYVIATGAGGDSGFSNIAVATTEPIVIVPSPSAPSSPQGETDLSKLQHFQNYDNLANGTVVPHVAWPGGTITTEVTLGGHKVVKDTMKENDIGDEDQNYIGFAKNIGENIGEGDEFWWRQYHYYPTGFSFGANNYKENDPGHRKHLRVRQHDAGCADLAVIGPGGNVRGPQNCLQGYHEDTGINPIFDNTWSVYAFDRAGTNPIATGRWSSTEVYIKASKYESVGRWCVWIDGNLLPIGMINQKMLGTSRGDEWFSAVLYITHWNGGAPKDQTFYWGRGAWAVRKANGSVDQTPHMEYDPQTGLPFIGLAY